VDHNEAIRRFEHLMVREADRAQEAATELDGLASLLPSDKSRQFARLQAKANHQRANDFRKLAQKVTEK
jgi:hypothetical protein